MKKLKKRGGCCLFLVVLLGLGAFWAIENVLPYSIIRPYRSAPKQQPADFSMAAEDVSIIGFENVVLRGWLVLAEKTAEKKDTARLPRCLIFCHGIANNRGAFLATAKKMSALGWHCLLLDGRAHGASDGENCTFGYFEKRDLERAVDFLENRFSKTATVGIWGASLGGAIALQALENDERLDFGIVESTFTDLSTVVSDYQKRLTFGLRLPAVTQKALKKAGEIAHFPPDSVRPAEAARRIEQPIFYAHGSADERISVEHGKCIFENLASEKKEIFLVEKGRHTGIHAVGGAALEQKIGAFLSQF